MAADLKTPVEQEMSVELRRQRALAELEILDTAAEAEFDELVQLASEISGCPISLISLVDQNRQWFKAKVGTNVDATPRDISFCTHAIEADGVYIVNDASKDPKFADNPLVTGDPNIRFYSGHPLVTAEGLRIGTLCSIDRVPKELTASQTKQLSLLASQAVRMMEMRLANIKLKRSEIERAHALALLDDANERFDRCAHETELGVWYCDLPFDVLVWNPEVKKHFFLPPDAVVTIADFYRIIHPEDREYTRKSIEYAIANNRPYKIIYRTVNPEDPTDIKHIQATGWTDYLPDGTPKRFDGITRDVTIETKLKDDMLDAYNGVQESKEEAERANAAKSAFLANMSHEIRSPLGAIMGFAELSLQEEETSKEVTGHLEVIHRNAVQVLHIIDDVLDLAKVEAGKVSVEKMDVRFIKFINDFTATMRFRAEDNGIAFNLCFETEVPDRLLIDETRVRQILSNAVGNAIKFTSQGHVELKVSYNEQVLTFKVSDTGRGISEEQSKSLFKAFTQADASTTRKFGGTGLGLVLTRNLCQLMGGNYDIESSELGVGSVFVAQLVAEMPENAVMVGSFEKTASGPGKGLPKQTSDGNLNGIKVLLVEDSPDNQELLKIILERQGAQFTLAENGLLGVQAAMNGDHDVVLMDVQMPVLDGHEAVRRLRRQGFAKPVIALTAHGMKEEMQKAEKSGFTDYLMKPIDKKKLIQSILSHSH